MADESTELDATSHDATEHLSVKVSNFDGMCVWCGWHYPLTMWVCVHVLLQVHFFRHIDSITTIVNAHVDANKNGMDQGWHDPLCDHDPKNTHTQKKLFCDICAGFVNSSSFVRDTDELNCVTSSKRKSSCLTWIGRLRCSCTFSRKEKDANCWF